MTHPRIPEHQVLVPLKSRTTLGEKNTSVASSVSCPVQGKELQLEDCTDCERSEGFHHTEHKTFVRCNLDEGRADGVWDPSLTPIASIMTTDVICVQRDLPIADLEQLLLDRGISGVPVANEQGCPVGVASRTDVMRYNRQRTGVTDDARAEDIMMPLPFCLPANESIAKAAALMAFEGVHRLPIVSPSGVIVGIVSPLDLLRWFARAHGYVIANRE